MHVASGSPISARFLRTRPDIRTVVQVKDATSLLVRPLCEADLDALVTLASRSFFDAYCETDDHAVIREYCSLNFTLEQFASVLADPKSRIIVATAGANDLVGYAHVCVSIPPPCVHGPSPVELSRIYLSKDWIGRGVGALLMRASIDQGIRLGGRTLWLGVYERNPRAMAFYRRFGMRVVGTKPWEWGGETFQDPVMERAIDEMQVDGLTPGTKTRAVQARATRLDPG